jgi:hypothetical protein
MLLPTLMPMPTWTHHLTRSMKQLGNDCVL